MISNSISYIEIDSVHLYANHGVEPQENRVGAHYNVSLRIYFDASAAMTTDNVHATIDYGIVVDIIKAEMARPSALLEHVAFRIRQSLCARFPSITAGRVSISKLHPPLQAKLQSVSFVHCW